MFKMVMTIHLLQYNNYNNNLIKKFDSISEYEPYEVYTIAGVNFRFNNGVDTAQVLNSYPDDIFPDYCVLTDEKNQINSRWFVMDARYECNGQFTLSLHRDVIADNMQNVLNSTCYINKGFVTNDNPLIFSNENVSFNQIKKGQQLLYNDARTAWLVAYLNRTDNEGSAINYSVDYKTVSPFVEPGECPITDMIGTNTYLISNDIKTASIEYGPVYLKGKFVLDGTKVIWEDSYKDNLDGYPELGINSSVNDTTGVAAYNAINTSYKQSLGGSRTSAVTGDYTDDYVNSLLQYNGKTYMIDGVAKTINISLQSVSWLNRYKYVNIQNNYPNIKEGFMTAYNHLGLTGGQNSPGNYITVEIGQIVITANEITQGFDTKANFTFNNGAMTTDAPYEIIAIPYKNLNWIDPTGIVYNHTKEMAISFLNALSNKYYGANGCFDVQLVPYIEWDNESEYDASIRGYKLNYNRDVDSIIPIMDGVNNPITFAIRLNKASFKKLIKIPYGTIIESLDSNNKRSVNCDMYRLVSPNGNGDFEWSPAKNGGVNYFNIDCTLLPGKPYINVSPVFSGLYGSDFQDYRGLICGGDYSLPVLSNDWLNYQLQNKNYENIFNRQIDTMEFNNKYSKAQDIANAITGTVSGSVSGAMVGSMSPIPGGGMIGAAIGGITSLGAGIADVSINEKLRNRAVEDAKIMFDYSIGNIKARSHTLTRVTSFNIDNPFFPYIEVYSCTDEEKAIFDNIIKWQGMSINCIDILNKYIDYSADWTYVQGYLIDDEEIRATANITTTINERLSRGVRLQV